MKILAFYNVCFMVLIQMLYGISRLIGMSKTYTIVLFGAMTSLYFGNHDETRGAMVDNEIDDR
jgi:hypothetical protein